MLRLYQRIACNGFVRQQTTNASATQMVPNALGFAMARYCATGGEGTSGAATTVDSKSTDQFTHQQQEPNSSQQEIQSNDGDQSVGGSSDQATQESSSSAAVNAEGEVPSKDVVAAVGRQVNFHVNKLAKYGDVPDLKPGQYPVRVTNISPSVMKTDIQDFFQQHGIPVGITDIGCEYSLVYRPLQWYVALQSPEDVKKALNLNQHFLGAFRARLFPSDMKAMQSACFDLAAQDSHGRFIHLQNLPENVTASQVIDFFRPYNVLPNTTKLFNVPGQQHRGAALRTRAIIGMATTDEAHRAVRERHRLKLDQKQAMIHVIE